MMKKTINKTLSVILSFAIILSAAPLISLTGFNLPNLSTIFGIEAQAVAYSGTCGENLSWAFDESNGKLTISGTGEMDNWSKTTTSSQSAPWFTHRESIISVTVENGVTSIGDYAFNICRELKSITIGKDVNSISPFSFNDCKSLSSISVDSENPYFSNDSDGVLYNKAKTELVKYPLGIVSAFYEVPDGVTYIGDYAFYYCNNLLTMLLPDTLTNIGDYAFYSSGIGAVPLPESLESIGEFSFFNCQKLRKVKIPDSLTYLGANAFSGCISIEDLEIGTGLTDIPENAFSKCSSVQEIIIPGNVKHIGDYAFDSTTADVLTISEGVAEIGFRAFYYCDNLTEIKIPASVTYIDDSAFSFCQNVTEITIGSIDSTPTVSTTIGENAFSACKSLKDLTIGKNVVSIGNNAFSSCKSLKKVTVPNNVTDFGSGIFSGCTNLSDVTICEGITKIASLIFSECISLTNIVIPDSVTSIESGAFFNSAITQAEIPDSVKDIGSSAFANCDNLESVVIPDGVTQIGEYAFLGCENLAYVHIPSTVTSIGTRIFSDSSTYICSETESCYAKTYADENGYEFRVCDNHGYADAGILFDSDTDVSIQFGEKVFSKDVVLKAERIYDGLAYYIASKEISPFNFAAFSIKAFVNDVEVQPEKAVTVKIPVPDNFNTSVIKLYGINIEDPCLEEVPFSIVNGYMVFETEKLGYFAVAEESETSIVIKNAPESAQYKDSITLYADAENLFGNAKIVWKASDSKTKLEPSADGKSCKVTFLQKGAVTITAETTDAYGNTVSSSCEIKVNFAWWQWIIYIGLFGWIWY